MRTVKAAIAAASIATLAACGGNVDHGTITSKEYIPGSHWVYLKPVYGQRCVTVLRPVRLPSGVYISKSVRSCTSYVSGHVPIIEKKDACYELHLKNSSGDTGSVCVGQDAWDNAKVGGQW